MKKTGYCFRCDAPADGDVCPQCGARLYHEPDHAPPRPSQPVTVGEAGPDRQTGLGPWAIVAIVLVAVLLVAIALVASSALGVA